MDFPPREEWPSVWKSMRNPACLLILSLHGHPDSGGHWERHCEGHLCWRFQIIWTEREPGKKGWRLVQEACAGCPKGIEIDPPTNVAMHL
eukprot:3267165-Pyramimonas_sp.AAC.1